MGNKINHLEAHKISKLKFKEDGTPFFPILEDYLPMRAMIRDYNGLKGFFSYSCKDGKWYEFAYSGNKWINLTAIKGDRLTHFDVMEIFRRAIQKKDVKRAIDFFEQ